MADPQVLKIGALAMRVCVPRSYTEKQVESFANGAVLCGTENGWKVCQDGSATLNGDPAAVPCDQHEENVHMVLEA